MKVSAKYYREIEYVLVSELPDEQQELLKQYKELDYIKISVEGVIVGPCLQYKHYSDWYATAYNKEVKHEEIQKDISIKKLFLQKA